MITDNANAGKPVGKPVVRVWEPPRYLRILGHLHTVKMVDINETDFFGKYNMNTSTILLNQNKSLEQIQSTLLHEIIEAIDYNLALGLTPTQISGLEAVLFQVIKDNDLFRQGGGIRD